MKKRFNIADVIVGFLLIGFIVFMLGVTLGTKTYKGLISPMFNGEVEHVNCTKVGCSFLVEYKDQSKDWVWVPAPKEK